MNEAQLVMYLLSRRKDSTTIGSTKDEIYARLGLSDRNTDYKLWNMVKGLNTSLFPLGMLVKFNPMNAHWYIGFQDKMELEFGGSIHTLSPRLAATLFTILILYVSKSDKITIAKVQELRNKKDILKDLRELEDLGYVYLEDDAVSPTPKIFYYIDIDELVEKIKELKDPNGPSEKSSEEKSG